MAQQNRHGWHETYAGGSPEAEAAQFERFACEIVAVQRKIAAQTGRGGNRTLHAKITTGLDNAQLLVDTDLPADLRVGHIQPGRNLPAILRFSNASSLHRPDGVPDMRGVALRLDAGADGAHDLLMTSYPVSHARDARQFVEVLKIASGPRALILPRFLMSFGPSETLRILRNVRAGMQPAKSIAAQHFWSRGAVLWGDAGPVRLQLVPMSDVTGEPLQAADPEAQHAEMAARLRFGAVRFRLCVQRYVDAASTPIEDGAVEWREDVAPPTGIATLVLPQQDIAGAEGQAAQQAVDALAFSPWNAPPAFRPLGNLNRARKSAYAASARAWQGGATSPSA